MGLDEIRRALEGQVDDVRTYAGTDHSLSGCVGVGEEIIAVRVYKPRHIVVHEYDMNGVDLDEVECLLETLDVKLEARRPYRPELPPKGIPYL